MFGKEEYVQSYIEKEQARFMKKYAEKTISDLAADFGISMENGTLRAMKMIETELSTKFVAELLEEPQFQRFTILRYFSSGDENIFGLEFFNTEEPCRHCGAVVENWYSLCINPDGAKFDYTSYTNLERETDVRYEGRPIAAAKSLLEKYGLLD